MKLIGITANQIVSRTCPTKSTELTFIFNGYVEWVCTESKKGIDSYDEIETTVSVNIHEFLEWFDTKTINELKKALINHIKTK